MPGKRVDELLVAAGLCADLETARRRIMAGLVRVGPDHVVRSATERWPSATVFTVNELARYVSRGGDKLEPILRQHLPRLDGLVAVDLGASTGGFTDLLLQRGCARVYASDVGRGLLHWRLRQDPRVICLEGTHARDLTRDLVPEPVNVLTADVSFISLRAVLPPVAALLAARAWCFVLVKPQFEAARDEVAPGGVVRDAAVIARVVAEIVAFCAADLGWRHVATAPAALPGPSGNREQVAVFRTA